MTDTNQHLDEGTIHAWLDGALAPDESARVEAHATTCAACGALVAEARGLIAASSRILSSLDAVPAGVIPGSGEGVDQLAVLRAKRRATTRRWWRDPRVAVAASLVFIAGTVSVMWRSMDQTDLARHADALVSADTAGPVETVPGARPNSAAVAESREPDAKMEARDRSGKPAERSATEKAPPTSTVVITGVASEATSSQKTAAAPTPDARSASVAANEAKRADQVVGAVRQALDSTSAMERTRREGSRDSLSRQQVVQTPQAQQRAGQQGQRLGLEPLRADSGRGTPQVLSSRLARAAGASGAGLRLSDMASPAGVCYEVRAASPEDVRAASVPDTVRLLPIVAAEARDTAWKRALSASPTQATLSWKMIDSVTVELRVWSPSDSTVVRFSPVGAPPSVRDLPNVRIVVAERIVCRN